MHGRQEIRGAFHNFSRMYADRQHICATFTLSLCRTVPILRLPAHLPNDNRCFNLVETLRAHRKHKLHSFYTIFNELLPLRASWVPANLFSKTISFYSLALTYQIYVLVRLLKFEKKNLDQCFVMIFDQ